MTRKFHPRLQGIQSATGENLTEAAQIADRWKGNCEDLYCYEEGSLGSRITEDGECTTELRTRLNRVQAIGASLLKIWKSYSIPISAKIRLAKALVWL